MKKYEFCWFFLHTYFLNLTKIKSLTNDGHVFSSTYRNYQETIKSRYIPEASPTPRQTDLLFRSCITRSISAS